MFVLPETSATSKGVRQGVTVVSADSVCQDLVDARQLMCDNWTRRFTETVGQDADVGGVVGPCEGCQGWVVRCQAVAGAGPLGVLGG